ncbi:MAG: hypothetical protein V1922_04850 [bacterium]
MDNANSGYVSGSSSLPSPGKNKILVVLAITIPILIILFVSIRFLASGKGTSKDESVTQISLSNNSYSYSKKAQLYALTQKLPVKTKDFSLLYDSASNSVVLEKNSPSADSEIDKWFHANGILNIFSEKVVSETTVIGNIYTWLKSARLYNNKSANGKMICDGGYADGEICDPAKKTCVIGLPLNDSGLVGTWAYFQAYKKTKDPQYLTILQNDLEVYSNYDKISTIQAGQYAMKWLFEMYESPLLSDGDRMKISQIIYRVQYDPRITTPLSAEYAQSPPTSFVQNKKSILDFMKLFKNIEEIKKSAYLVSEYTYAYQYLLKTKLGDANEYKNQAIYLFKKTKESYDQIYKISDETPYLLSIAAYDLYQIDKNEEYVKYAHSLSNAPCESARSCVLQLFDAHLWKLPDLYSKTLGTIKNTQVDLLEKKIIYNNQIRAQEMMIYDLFNNALFAGIVSSHE